MTTADSSPEFLKCIICHEVFQDPVTLGCGHSLCTKCVTGDTSQQPDTDERKPMTCPVCGKKISNFPSNHSKGEKGGNGEKGVEGEKDGGEEERGGDINTSSFIKRLAEQYTSAKTGEDKACGLCKDDGETKLATVWCSDCGYALCGDCNKVHKKLETSHTTTDIAEQVPRTARPKCGKHRDSIVDLMCEDCAEAVCQRCCILEHRGCKKVTPLEDSTDRLDSLLEQYSKELKNDIPSIESHISACRTQTDKVNDNMGHVETAIDETSDELVAEIRDQQKQLKEKLERMKEEELHQLSEEIKSGEFRLADAHQRIGLAQEAKNSASAIDHYEIYKLFTTLRGVGSNNKRRIRDGENGANVSFVDNKDTLIAALQRRKIGYLKGMSDKKSQEEGKRKIDTGSSGLHGITVLTFEGTKVVVVTNPNYKLVQSFYTKLDQEQSCYVKLDSSAYGITQLETSKAAVTIPKKKQIVIFRVEPKLEKDSTIKTQLRYLGLTCLSPTTLAASGEETGFIDIIDLSGTRLKSFGADIFSKHLFLCTTLDNNILVSDVDYDRVVCVNDEGDIQFSYEPRDKMILGAARGISQGVRGDILLVDRGNHKVIQLDQTGQFVRQFLTFADEISDPNCIHVDSDNVIYVSVDGRYIHVHEMEDD